MLKLQRLSYRLDVQQDGRFGDDGRFFGLFGCVFLKPLLLETLCLFVHLIVAAEQVHVIVVILIICWRRSCFLWRRRSGLLKKEKKKPSNESLKKIYFHGTWCPRLYLNKVLTDEIPLTTAAGAAGLSSRTETRLSRLETTERNCSTTEGKRNE